MNYEISLLVRRPGGVPGRSERWGGKFAKGLKFQAPVSSFPPFIIHYLPTTATPNFLPTFVLPLASCFLPLASFILILAS